MVALSDNTYELTIKNADRSESYLLDKPTQNFCQYVMGSLTATINLGSLKIIKNNTNLVIDTWRFDLTNTKDKTDAVKVLDCLSAM